MLAHPRQRCRRARRRADAVTAAEAIDELKRIRTEAEEIHFAMIRDYVVKKIPTTNITEQADRRLTALPLALDALTRNRP